MSDDAIEEVKVLVSKDQLTELINQNAEYKGDIIALVNVFKGFADLLSGKKNVMSIIPVITKLMSDESQLAKFAHIIPILDKYTENNVKEEPGATEQQ
jgi:hypothetical protein